MNAEQEKALREYLQEAIVPLIEQVLIKKLGQAMSFAAELVAKHEREACAQVAEEPYEFTSEESHRIAATIRARGNNHFGVEE